MTLVDTSAWVDHFRSGNDALKRLLRDSEVVIHPFVLGELSLGEMRNRSEIMGLLANLPEVQVAEHREVMHLVGSRSLAGIGCQLDRCSFDRLGTSCGREAHDKKQGPDTDRPWALESSPREHGGRDAGEGEVARLYS